MMHLAERLSRLGTESAFEMAGKARALEAQGHKIIHLEIGEPDFATPEHIIAAGCTALHHGATHYSPPAGLPELRAAVARTIGRERGLELTPEQVVITPGAKPIMFFAILALVEAGQEVIYPNPGFPIYESLIRFVGARPVPMPLREERGFRLDVGEFRTLVNERTALVILNSPQNPTGGVLTRDDLAAIAEVCVAHDVPVLADEIYQHILYEGEFASITAQPGMSPSERTIILHGFSKSYAMTGWRLGYGVMPVPLAEHVARLMVNSNSCTAAATQWAGLAALEGPQDSVQTMVAAFRERRDVLVNGLNTLPGVHCTMPSGAFYAFPNIRGTGMNSHDCAEFMLHRAGVACLSGATFGAYGEGYLRLSYANTLDALREALEHMREALARG